MTAEKASRYGTLLEIGGQSRSVAAPVRHLPDGRPGVLVEGLLWPVSDADAVELGGVWFYPDDAVRGPAAAPAPAPWQVGAGPTLYLARGAAMERLVRAALREAGLTVTQEGEPADGPFATVLLFAPATKPAAIEAALAGITAEAWDEADIFDRLCEAGRLALLQRRAEERRARREAARAEVMADVAPVGRPKTAEGATTDRAPAAPVTLSLAINQELDGDVSHLSNRIRKLLSESLRVVGSRLPDGAPNFVSYSDQHLLSRLRVQLAVELLKAAGAKPEGWKSKPSISVQGAETCPQN